MRCKNQHMIPQVYLKLFGFKKKFKTEICFVSVRDIQKGIWQDREIGNFLSENYLYNLDSYKEISNFIIEINLNGQIETRLPKILTQLKNAIEITPNLHMAIAETTANFLCRNKLVLTWIKGWFKNKNFREFFDMITKGAFMDKAKADFIFNEYLALPEKDKVNTIMVHYMHYVSIVLRKASIEVLKGNEKLLFFTSDNPVSLMNDIELGELEKDEMDVYFPISPKFLIRFYWQDKSLEIQRNIVDISPELYDFYHEEVIPNSALNFIISPIDKSLIGK